MIVNANSIVQHLIQFKNSIIIHVSVNTKINAKAKKIISGISTLICGNSKYLKSIADIFVTECDEIIIVMDTIGTKKTNIIVIKMKNVMSTTSINCHSK